MIRFHWSYLATAGFCATIAFVAGMLWNIPVEQASGIVTNLVGFLLGAVGVAVTLWVAASDRGMKFDQMHKEMAEVREAVSILREGATRIWQPALNRLLGEPGVSAAVLASAAEQTGSDVRDKIEQQLDASPPGITEAKGDGKDEALQKAREELLAGLQASVTEEVQRMMKVAQIATLTPVEQYLLRHLHEMGGSTRRAYWTTWAVPGTQPFPTDQIEAARQRLLDLGLVLHIPHPPHVFAELAPGVGEAVVKYEDLYGPIHPTPREETEIIERRLAELGTERNQPLGFQ